MIDKEKFVYLIEYSLNDAEYVDIYDEICENIEDVKSSCEFISSQLLDDTEANNIEVGFYKIPYKFYKKHYDLVIYEFWEKIRDDFTYNSINRIN